MPTGELPPLVLPLELDLSGAKAQSVELQQSLEALDRAFNKLQDKSFQIHNPHAIAQILATAPGQQMVASSPALQQAIGQVQQALPTAATSGAATGAGTGAAPKTQPPLIGPGVSPLLERQLQVQMYQTSKDQLAAQQQLTTAQKNAASTLKAQAASGTQKAASAAAAVGTSAPQSVSGTAVNALQAGYNATLVATAMTRGGVSLPGAVQLLGASRRLGGAAGSAVSSLFSGLSQQNAAGTAGADTAGGLGADASGTGTPASDLSVAAGNVPSGIGGLLKKFGPIGEAIAMLGAAGLAVNQLTADMAQTSQNLTANVGGAPTGGQLRGQTLGSSLAYIQTPADVASLYEQLGRSGVPGNRVASIANSTLAFSRATGLGLGTTGSLAATMSAQGNLSPDQIGAVFDAVVQGSKVVGVSMTKLVDTMTTFAKATGNTALSMKGQEQLMGMQAFFGPSVNAGAVLAPMASASGAQAMQLSAILGISQGQLYQEQQGQSGGLPALWDQMSAEVRRVTAGTKGTQKKINIGESFLNNTGYMPQGLGVTEQAHLLQLMLSGKSAGGSIAQFLGKIGTPSAGALQKQGAGIAATESSALERAWNAGVVGLESTLQNPGGALGGTLKALGNFAGGAGTDLSGLLKDAEALPTEIGNALGTAGQTLLDGLHALLTGGSPVHAGAQGGKGGPGTPGYVAPTPAPPGWTPTQTGAVRSATIGGMTVPSQYLPFYVAAAKKSGVPLADLLSQGVQESGFQANPPGGDSGGIAQFTSGTWNQLATQKGSPNYGQPFSAALNPAIAIPTQAYFLAQLAAQYGGNRTKMLEAYYGGAGGVASPNEVVPGGPTPAQYAATVETRARSLHLTQAISPAPTPPTPPDHPGSGTWHTADGSGNTTHTITVQVQQGPNGTIQTTVHPKQITITHSGAGRPPKAGRTLARVPFADAPGGQDYPGRW